MIITRRQLLLRSALAAPAVILPSRRLLRARPMHGQGGGSGSYHASAVQFRHGNSLASINPLTLADSPVGTLSYWVLPSALSLPNPQLVEVALAPDGFSQMIANQGGWNSSNDVYVTFARQFDVHAPNNGSGTLVQGNWAQAFFSWDVGQVDGAKIANYWFNGASVNPVQRDGNDPFALVYNGYGFGIPGYAPANLQSSDPNGYADVQFWSNQIVDPNLHIDKFRNPTTGKPVDPAVAAAAFGPHDVLLSGNKTGFIINQGTAGPMQLRAYVYGAGGSNGPGSISIPFILAGTGVASVIRQDNSADVSSEFESVISISEQIQQTGSSDLSAVSLFVNFVPYIDNAASSPSD